MPDQIIQVPADSTGKKVDTSELTVGANTVQRQRVVLADATGATALAPVSATNGLSVAVTVFPDNEPFNVAQYGGTAVGAGNAVHVQPGTGVVFPVSDNAASLTVDGTVTANAGTGTFLARANDGTNSETTLFDVDSGAGTQYVRGVSFRKSANGGSVEGGTATDPLRIDPTGTTVQPISLPNEGQQTMANSISVAVASDQTAVPVSGTVTANIGTFPDNEPFNLAQYGGTNVGATNAVHVQSGTGAAFPVTDNGGVLTVDGTVTANAGTGDFLGIAAHTRNEAFKEANAVGGELDDTSTVAATEGNVSPARITAQRAFHVNLRNASGTELGNGTTPVCVDTVGTTKTLKTAVVSLSATGTVIAAVSGKRLKVYAIKLIVDAALSVNWRDGAATALEGAQALAANGGYTEAVNPPAFLLATTAGNTLDLVISGTGNAQGRVSYWDDDSA